MGNNSHSNNRSLIDEVESEIFKTSLDLSKDFSEIGLDMIMENELISKIPIVNTAAAFYNIGKELHKRHYLRNLLTFLSEFHSGQISEEELLKFKMKFEENPKFRTKILELILMHNERFNRTIKSKIMGNLFRAYINGDITFEKLTHLLEILESITVRGLKILETLGNNDSCKYFVLGKTPFWLEEIKFSNYEFILLTSCGIANLDRQILDVNDDGVAIYNYGIVG